MYKITIVKVEQVEVQSKEYQQIREPYKDDIERTVDKSKDPQYDYRVTTKIQNQEVVILQQSVEEVNFQQVIKAINGIE